MTELSLKHQLFQGHSRFDLNVSSVYGRRNVERSNARSVGAAAAQLGLARTER